MSMVARFRESTGICAVWAATFALFGSRSAVPGTGLVSQGWPAATENQAVEDSKGSRR